MNRRQWLKTSTFAATGLLVSSSLPSCGPGQTPSERSPLKPETLKLNSNESPYGVSEKARQAMIEAMEECHLYPHQKYAELIEIIAERERLTPDHIILGGGSTEVMNMIIRAFGPAGTILVSNPTYFDFLYYAELAGCAFQHIPLNDTFEHDLESTGQAISPETGLVYICNPNNPTGSITPKGGLSAFCERFSEKVLVVVDEAYHDYVEDASYSSMMDLVRRNKNVIVTRTFSKIFGMAGLRVGYGVARPETIDKLKRVEMNFASISYPSLKAAVSSYTDLPFLSSVLEKNRLAKAYLCTQLENRGYTYIPSHTNFVLFEVKRPAEDVAQEFKGKNILVRPFQFRNSQWIRVSIGTLKDMQTFASAFAI
ncbi:MAG: histidinol-phosphate transaminase [Candidatus Aminicenantes bacterium]|nr:histidinol-phosphate transaminase [Candidatus Aminicenantes bacterium]